MKSLLVTLGVIFSAFVIFYPYNSFAEAKIKYDKFKDVTVVSIEIIKEGRLLIGDKSIRREIQPTIRFSGSYPGQGPSIPNDCKFEYTLLHRNLRYRGCPHDLYCLADGNPIAMQPSKRRVQEVIVDHYPKPDDKRKDRWGGSLCS